MALQTTSWEKHYQLQQRDITNVLKEFTKPIQLNCFFNNLDYLLNNSLLVEFNVDTWKMRPHLFCHDYYEAQYLYPVLLLVNKITSIFDFLPANFENNLIIAPEKRVIFRTLVLKLTEVEDL